MDHLREIGKKSGFISLTIKESLMEDPIFIPIHEIILKSEKESGNLLILKEHALAESSLIMFVGEPEILAIAKEKGLVQTPRPLTHELYLSILDRSGIEFVRVEIYDLKDQTYFAKVVYRLNQEEITPNAAPVTPSPWPCIKKSQFWLDSGC